MKSQTPLGYERMGGLVVGSSVKVQELALWLNVGGGLSFSVLLFDIGPGNRGVHRRKRRAPGKS